MELTTAFLAELAAAGGEPAATAHAAAELEGRLQALAARGRSAHPSLAAGEAMFGPLLARSAARAVAAGGSLDDLAAEDLYLASACAAGVEGSVALFEARCGQRIHAALSGLKQGEEERREIEQRLRHLLLVGGPEGPPRIASYSGQGALDRWAAVVAQRLLVTVIRKDQSERRAREAAALENAGQQIANASPEIALLKERYRSEFEQAMSEALSAVGERDRLVLRLHLCSHITVDSIGKMYGVAQSTASRWLLQARQAVSDEALRLLRERLGLRPSELQSLAGLVASQIDVSVSRLLAPHPGPLPAGPGEGLKDEDP